jgi:hypothetical protein
MKTLPLFARPYTTVFTRLHLKSTRARVLALFVLAVVLSTAGYSASSANGIRGFFGFSTGTSEARLGVSASRHSAPVTE